MAFNPNGDEPVRDLVNFRSRGNEVSPFNGRAEDQLSGPSGNTYNLHYGNTYNFHFGQPSPQSNTASTSSGMSTSQSDPFTSMSQDDAMSGRSSVTSQNDDSICNVCLQRSPNGVIFNCGHPVCNPCGQRLKSTKLSCPVCKMPIQCIKNYYREF
ncbi:uncharacterized protein LOC111136288 isoform X2 [Crassostrea virginica]|mmetsp:Transcript_39203/g.63638  ORF Transcript_39203/g.63638 Transcript_39203/m.63638 type:complete len:155 (-) Transcript_39203:235-699(-)